jgi:hypothetical protein
VSKGFSLKAEKMPKGNPNPDTSNLKPFRKGKSGNPGGKTSEQKRLELENAERAVRIRDRFLRSLEAKLNDIDMDAVLERLDAQALKLLKDAEDRGLGQPVQPHTSPDGSMSPTEIIIRGVKPNNGDD